MIIDQLIVQNRTGFKDNRGEFYCSYKATDKILSGGMDFKEWDFSYNRKNVLRGLHCDLYTWKFVECIHGEVFWAAVDARHDSKTYKNIFYTYISQSKHTQILVPPGVLTGFFVTSSEAIFYYRQTNIYDGCGKQYSVIWSDPLLNIPWPCSNPILSERDTNAKTFEEVFSV